MKESISNLQTNPIDSKQGEFRLDSPPVNEV